MPDKLAIKRLTASDLTFFEWHFKNRNAGNQKAINLNADVFSGQLYPALDTIIRNRQDKLGIDLWITGPGKARPLNLQRKIIKGAAYKNWRLDGEFIYNPDDTPDRFNVLESGDIALLGFDGELEPVTVTLVLVAKRLPQDKALFGGLNDLLGTSRMTELGGDALRELCHAITVPETHPVWLMVSEEDVAEAALGQAPAVSRLLRRPHTAKLTLEGLRKARRDAEEIGRLGEELMNCHLSEQRAAGEIADYEWVSDINAIAPYDFRVQSGDSWEKLEVKTTAGNFDREFHLPLSELREMTHGGEVYRIARVYHATADGARMRISHDLQRYGQTIIDAFVALPDGVTPNGVTIVPDESMFKDGIDLTMLSEEED